MEKIFRAVHQNLRDNLVDVVEQIDRSEMIDQERLQSLWDESNKSMVLLP
jgi:hypothetical protein